MNTLKGRALFLTLLFTLTFTSVAEARIGGGGMRGGRGFRSFGTRSAPVQPMNPARPNYQSPPQQNQPYGAPQPAMGGSFTRGLMGGLAGGMIGSMLFGHSGYGGGGMGGGGGGFGLIEMLLLGGLVFWLFKRFAGAGSPLASGGAYREMNPVEKLRSVPTGPFVANSDDDGTAELRRYDNDFDPAQFKDARMDDFVKLQAAWNHRDLSSVSSMITTELRNQLDADIAQLKSAGQINRIENISVRGTDLVESWAERGYLYVTLRFRANLTDFTVNESSGALVSGDRDNPIKFEEDWTFVRPIDDTRAWKLSAIEA